ncbi:hypothetical protein CPT_Moabite_014 [Serratia phage Moabite]|uniref:Uncharacterized protein n=3 Tax=Moabitevirus TaxID=2843422 RepID=A0A7T3NBX6_9CAUD|nr:hypothetical protein HWB23_gp283 [Serratia phage vB_SmaM_ 2050HW]YP_009849110.1 hypothetical protein HWC48_gp014 [Serratia phage Moabite]QPX76803.1 hypothetical protein [Serratia phage vB_SmaM_Yaphecito]UGO54232.1 hypothetical protein HAYMO_250 [Serratia phage vB_SmaM_Haymo]UQT03738.1 hypothetical protein KODAMA_02710 [Serratia phage vB_SmaM-Kodama]URG14128.1 hypothetical protein [Pectobacterium phage vB_ParM-25]ATA65618.1 hypothetical protein 2050HW_00283 [Serratia phage vB_SmaM_ 2050HW]
MRRNQAVIDKSIEELNDLCIGGPETKEKTLAISSAMMQIFTNGLGLMVSASEEGKYPLGKYDSFAEVSLASSRIYGQIVVFRVRIGWQDTTFTRFVFLDEAGAPAAAVDDIGTPY